MFRRSVRIACLVVAALATSGLGYRVFDHETSLSNERRAAVSAEHAVSQVAELLLDLRGSLHAYVAPGQGLPYWGKRAQEGIDMLRDRLKTLDAMVTPAGGSLTASVEAVGQLEAAEQRARTYVSREEMQLAGDVIFTEVRDVLAGMTGDVQSVRDGLRRNHERQAARLRQEQLMLAGAMLAVWVLIAVVFLPSAPEPAVEDPAQWRNQLKETLQKPAPSEAPKIAEPTPVAEPAQPVVAIGTLRTVSEICSDLSALADGGALPGALERVNRLLDATGLIVWVAANDASSLSPVAIYGFDPRVVNRIGKVPRDSANLTASAFRDNAPRISAPTSSAPGALAVPMCGPSGPSGVLSVELKPGQAVEEAKVALASIVAAQLATLTMPIAQDVAAPAIEAPEVNAQSA